MIVVLAEKPAVARDLAAVLGATERKAGWLEGNGYQVTWAIGHLVGLAQPHEIHDAWKRWDAAVLPMMPDIFPLVPRDGVEKQLKVVSKLFNARGTKSLVCATDAGREGELIFRLIYEAVDCKKPFQRLWISSLTRDSIQEGFRKLKPGSAYDALAAAARVRNEADWLVGMNFSRAYSLVTDEQLSVGRVKTPTLAMVVARDAAIAKFAATPYREVVTRFTVGTGAFDATYVRQDYDAAGKPKWLSQLPPAAANGSVLDATVDADAIAARARSGAVTISAVEEETRTSQPPLLFDLTELQRAANKLWGWTAKHTLGVAQELYEVHKALSYPRSDSRHLSASVAATLGPTVALLRGRYEAALVAGTGTTKLSKRFVDDAKVSDHHALIPTATPLPASLSGSDAAKLHDLVCRRFLCAWQPDAVDALTEVTVLLRADGFEDRYQARGKVVVKKGWRALDLAASLSVDKEGAQLPNGLRANVGCAVEQVRIDLKKTKPPDRLTEATLLSAMETAGASLGGELSQAMKDRGLGTPATRAAIIDELVTKGYMVRVGKALRPTELGILLVMRVHPHVASPSMTGEWEARLRQVERGELDASVLLDEVRGFVQRTVVAALANGVAPRRAGFDRSRSPRSGPPVPRPSKPRGASPAAPRT